MPDDVVDALAGHSTRVGGVQDMIASGIELPAILQSGRWKTTNNWSGTRLRATRRWELGGCSCCRSWRDRPDFALLLREYAINESEIGDVLARTLKNEPPMTPRH